MCKCQDSGKIIASFTIKDDDLSDMIDVAKTKLYQYSNKELEKLIYDGLIEDEIITGDMGKIKIEVLNKIID